MTTIKKQATVKVMLSYDYNHFEASLSLENEDGLKITEINEARKECQRLCNEAIRQYKEYKKMETTRTNQSYEHQQLIRECDLIRQKKEEFWTVTEKAKVKALEDHDWNSKYNFDDDDEYFQG